MTVEFRLPDIGEGLHEAEIVEWLVAVGDRVGRNQPVAEILTDKSQAEMPAPSAGTVVKLGGAVGDIVKVGDVLIIIDDGASSDATRDVAAGADSGADDDILPADSPFTAALDAPETEPVRETPALRPKAAPATRRLAAELGIDLHQVSGSGPGGRILAADVQAAASRTHSGAALGGAAAVAGATTRTGSVAGAVERSATTATAALTLGQMDFGTHPLRGIRRATAKAMDLSWSTIPHVTTMDEIDASELLLARSRAKESLAANPATQEAPSTPVNITPLSLMMVAVARSLRRFPMLNASLDLDAESITVHDRINISLAVASDRGLMVPVIHDADRLNIVEMAHEVARVSTAARAGSISADQLAGSTCTVSNYGSNGGYFAAPIVRPGEACIIGFGAITPRPIVVDGEVVARPTLPIVFSADHRLIDGDVLAAFQEDLGSNLTRAISLLI